MRRADPNRIELGRLVAYMLAIKTIKREPLREGRASEHRIDVHTGRREATNTNTHPRLARRLAWRLGEIEYVPWGWITRRIIEYCSCLD